MIRRVMLAGAALAIGFVAVPVVTATPASAGFVSYPLSQSVSETVNFVGGHSCNVGYHYTGSGAALTGLSFVSCNYASPALLYLDAFVIIEPVVSTSHNWCSGSRLAPNLVNTLVSCLVRNPTSGVYLVILGVLIIPAFLLIKPLPANCGPGRFGVLVLCRWTFKAVVA